MDLQSLRIDVIENEGIDVGHCETGNGQTFFLIAFQFLYSPETSLLRGDEQLACFRSVYEEEIPMGIEVNLQRVPRECESLLFCEFPIDQPEFP